MLLSVFVLCGQSRWQQLHTILLCTYTMILCNTQKKSTNSRSDSYGDIKTRVSKVSKVSEFSVPGLRDWHELRESRESRNTLEALIYTTIQYNARPCLVWLKLSILSLRFVDQAGEQQQQLWRVWWWWLSIFYF